MTPYLTRSFGNPNGIHRMAREAAVALEEARGTMARVLGAEHADEIYFTSSGSESDNWILRGAVRLSIASDATADDIALLRNRVPACIKRARLISGMQ